jgi:3-hexulose-6-phosphate synthase
MKLQLALDFDNKKDALKICKKVKKYVDIIELGTPLIKQEGLRVLRKFKKFKKLIVADLKTMDTGFFEAEMAFKSGADIATVCGCADESTIKGAIKAARKYKKKICVDLISVKNNKKRAKQVAKWKGNYVIVHTGIDVQLKGGSPLKNLKEVSGVIDKKKIAVAGGINLKSIKQVKKYNPEIVIVGGAITKAKDPAKIAKKLKEMII